jgi:hypothetical protein
MTERTLDSLVASIKAERRYVGKRPYSHNIISCLLREIDQAYGRAAANKAVRTCRLTQLGWPEIPDA